MTAQVTNTTTLQSEIQMKLHTDTKHAIEAGFAIF